MTKIALAPCPLLLFKAKINILKAGNVQQFGKAILNWIDTKINLALPKNDLYVVFEYLKSEICLFFWHLYK